MSSTYKAVEQKIGSAYECACGVSFKHSSSYSRHQRRKCCSAATQRYIRSTVQQIPQRKRRREFDAVLIVDSVKNNAEMNSNDYDTIESEASDKSDDEISSSSHYSSLYTTSENDDNDDNSVDGEDRHYLADVWNESAPQDEKIMDNEYPGPADSASGQVP